MAEKRWVSIYSDPQAAAMVRDLKSSGVKAKTGHSPYVGHRTVEVWASNQDDLRRAASVLKRYGWIDSISFNVSFAADELKRSYY